MDKIYFVYMMANYTNTTLYTGVTNNLQRRVCEHKDKRNSKSFTAQYNCTKLVYFSETNDINEAIGFEKRIKAGSRKKKNNLVREQNPTWEDLSVGWF